LWTCAVETAPWRQLARHITAKTHCRKMPQIKFPFR
jgi:hypothetical protein